MELTATEARNAYQSSWRSVIILCGVKHVQDRPCSVRVEQNEEYGLQYAWDVSPLDGMGQPRLGQSATWVCVAVQAVQHEEHGPVRVGSHGGHEVMAAPLKRIYPATLTRNVSAVRVKYGVKSKISKTCACQVNVRSQKNQWSTPAIFSTSLNTENAWITCFYTTIIIFLKNWLSPTEICTSPGL